MSRRADNNYVPPSSSNYPSNYSTFVSSGYLPYRDNFNFDDIPRRNLTPNNERPSSYDRMQRMHTYKDRACAAINPAGSSDYQILNSSSASQSYQFTRPVFRTSMNNTSRENLKQMIRKRELELANQSSSYRQMQYQPRCRNHRLALIYKTESQNDSVSDRSVSSSVENLSNPSQYSMLRPLSPNEISGVDYNDNSRGSYNFSSHSYDNRSGYYPFETSPQLTLPNRVTRGGRGLMHLGEGLTPVKTNLTDVLFRLTVDDHQESSQNPNPSPNSKRDYSAEHRSGK